MRIALSIAALFLATHLFAEDGARLTLVVHHTWNGAPLDLPGPGLTTPADEISVTRLAYLLAEPSLQERGVPRWLTSRDWFGFCNGARGDLVQVLHGLPRRGFDALRFFIGPDATTDHADPSIYPARHPLNPLVNGLHWGWAGGFVYLAIEGNAKSRAQGRSTGYSFHLAGAANRMQITLPVAIDLTRDTTVEVEFAVEKLFGGANPLRVEDQNSTHSRDSDALAPQLKAQVESAFRVRSVHETPPEKLPERAQAQTSLVGTPYRSVIPRGVPIPQLPEDFPLTNERVSLGRALFHDPRLSRDGSQSCASCHDARFAFAEKKRFSVGVDKMAGERNAMPLFNLAWSNEFFWDGRSPSLREQALVPITERNEMHANLDDVTDRLTSDETYRTQFALAFGTPGISAERIGIALEAFELTLTSFDSKFDRSLRGEAQLSEAEKRGFQLFVTEYDPRQNQFGADCFHCHGGPLFADQQFHNNGIAIDPRDLGRARVTQRPADEGKFATPSLRNVALTAPYMHDGRFNTLGEVIEHYDHGVAPTATLDPNLAKHPREGLRLSAEDKRALVAFLETLTDESFAR